MNTELKAIIFDMDGVLLDSESLHYRVLHELLREYGFHYTQQHFVELCGVSEYDMWPVLLRMAGLSEDLQETLYQQHWARYQEDCERNGMPEFDGLNHCLHELKTAGYKLAVASGSLQDVIFDTMRKLCIQDLFDVIISTQECRNGKPNPEVFLLAAHRLQLNPAECLVIEDSRNGMLAAQQAGMKWVGFFGAQIPTDMSLARHTFSDYRSVTPQDFRTWYRKQCTER